MELNDHMIEGDDVLLENLILKHYLDDTDFVMENISCDNLLDLSLTKLYDENRYIFENVPNLSSAYPSLGRDPMYSSSINVLHDLPTQVPSLGFFRVDCEPSLLKPTLNLDSYFLAVAD